jgi:hypothetical protein
MKRRSWIHPLLLPNILLACTGIALVVNPSSPLDPWSTGVSMGLVGLINSLYFIFQKEAQ